VISLKTQHFTTQKSGTMFQNLPSTAALFCQPASAAKVWPNAFIIEIVKYTWRENSKNTEQSTFTTLAASDAILCYWKLYRIEALTNMLIFNAFVQSKLRKKKILIEVNCISSYTYN
jgi:hypothetical protein